MARCGRHVGMRRVAGRAARVPASPSAHHPRPRCVVCAPQARHTRAALTRGLLPAARTRRRLQMRSYCRMCTKTTSGSPDCGVETRRGSGWNSPSCSPAERSARSEARTVRRAHNAHFVLTNTRVCAPIPRPGTPSDTLKRGAALVCATGRPPAQRARRGRVGDNTGSGQQRLSLQRAPAPAGRAGAQRVAGRAGAHVDHLSSLLLRSPGSAAIRANTHSLLS